MGVRELKTRIEVKTFRDLVRLRISLSTFWGNQECYLFVIPTGDKQEKCIFFPKIYRFPSRSFLIHYCFFDDGSLGKDEGNLIKYNGRIDKLSFSSRNLKDSSFQYLTLYELVEISDALSPLESGEELLLKKEVENDLIPYYKGRSLADLIRIAGDLDTPILLFEKEKEGIYMTGFSTPVFPTSMWVTTVGPVLWAQPPPLPQGKSSFPFIWTFNGEIERILEKKKRKGRIAPLIHLKNFPFNLPSDFSKISS